MIKAVIFDMYETLITHYKCPLYFGSHMASDIGIKENDFQRLWSPTESDRSVGKISFEEITEKILRENKCYSKEMHNKIIKKRVETKIECFGHLHEEILPMLNAIKEKKLKVGLISNCFSEEVMPIRNSVLFPFFDAACLSYEEKIQKPNKEIFDRCLKRLNVKADECIYIGDGGSFELETAKSLGMKAFQAVWYFNCIENYPYFRKKEFSQIEKPLDVLNFCTK